MTCCSKRAIDESVWITNRSFGLSRKRLPKKTPEELASQNSVKTRAEFDVLCRELCSGEEGYHVGEEDRGEAEQSEYDEEISNVIPDYINVSMYIPYEERRRTKLAEDKKAALSIANSECFTPRGTFKTGAACSVHHEPNPQDRLDQ